MTQVKYGKRGSLMGAAKVGERKPRLDEEDDDDEKSGQREPVATEPSSPVAASPSSPAEKPRLSISSLEKGAEGEKSSRKSITSRSTGGKSPSADSSGGITPMLSSDKSMEVEAAPAPPKRKTSTSASPSVSTTGAVLKGYDLIDYDNIATRTGAVSISMHSPEDAAEDSKNSGGSGGGASETSKVSELGAASLKTLPVSSSSGKMMIDAYGRLIRVEGGPSSVTSSSSTSSTGSIFSLSSLTKESAEEKERKKIRLENDRLAKWTKMLKDWDEKFAVGDMEKNDLLKRRVRKGIPDAVRGVVYSKILGVDAIRKGKETTFPDLCGVETGEFDEIIRRDIHRTNPTHVMFMQKDGMGQEALYRVLRAYSLFDKEVGYCQGMGSFVSVMLTYTTEDESFWLLIGLLQGKHPIRDTYFPNLLGLRRSFYIFEKCLQKFLPTLSKHLQAETFSAPIYSSRWFGTLCADFPIETTLRIWDVLIFEGPKILYRVGLAVMKLAQKRLKAKKFEDLVDILRDVQQTVDADTLLDTAFSFNLKRSDIDKWSEKFNAREKESPGTI